MATDPWRWKEGSPTMVSRAPMLVATAIVLGLVPQALALLGLRGLTVGTTVLAITLLLCALGFATGRYRIFWGSWGVASVVLFLLYGMATPVGLLLVVPALFKNGL